MKKLLFLGGLWLAITASAAAQNGDGYWKRLQKSHPETTLEALQRNTPAVSQAPSGPTELGACRLSLVYKGKTRNITLESIQLMKQKGLKPGNIRQFRKEVLFTSGQQEIWLPVKSSLAEQLELEVRDTEPVLLYTTVLRDPDPQDSQLTLLVEDYQVK
ncbi:hypothetical protein [Rufibacter psychrotolerans]|uniref:hypothetical protein n=1 Tax=Rufibacter psychrotolerans TaxID=2812556 RepID=UPI001966F23A|nr:hypothetical protein [Rufibacter sp. SYSU D00308]